MKFKSPIEVQAGISDGDPTNPLGQSGYLLSSDGSNVNWISPGGLSAETAEAIVQPIKANGALSKGDPVYIVGFNNGQNTNIVAKADSSDPTKMPVVGLADDDYASQAFGTMTAFGSFNGDFDTTGGTESWAIGDIIFVKPGGGLTNIKPGGTDLIQNVAIVSRVNSQTGELEVIALGRTNDVPNLPAGRLFVGTAGVTSLLSDVVYIDDTNDRVGIGTTSPLDLLHIKSSTTDARMILDGASGFDAEMKFYENGNSKYTVGYDSASANFVIGTTNVDTNQRLVIDSSGNVGIGTTSPDTTLHIADSSSASTTFRISAQSNDANYAYIRHTDNTVNTSRLDFGTTYGYSTEVTAMSIFNGNVGIGTTNPSAKLNVSGGGIEVDNNGITKLTLNSISSFPTVIVQAEQSGAASPPMGQLRWDRNPGATGMQLNYLNGYTENSLRLDGSNFRVINNGSERMRIDSSGNVGIGTTSPAVNFQVGNGTTDTTSRFYFNDNTYTQINGYGLYMSRNSSYIRPTTDNTKILYIGANTRQWNVLSIDASTTTFNTNGSENMRITATGNVGIGTGANVDEKLHIQGSVDNDDVALKIENTFDDNSSSTPPSAAVVFSTASNNGHIRVFGAPADTAANHRMDIGATASTSYLTFSPSNTEKMRITSGGNVGIGTTNPAAKLHAYSSGKAAIIRSTQNIGLEVQGGGNGTDIAIFKNTSGTERFSLSSGGSMFNLGMASSSSANASLMHNSSTGLIYRYTSSIRYKEDVKDLTNAVDKIMKLRPVEFKPKDSLKYTTGMIAEEVFEVMPEITFESEVEGFDEPQVDGISYEPLHAYYIKAIQELSSKIESLETRIQTLENN